MVYHCSIHITHFSPYNRFMSSAGLSPLSIEEAVVRGFGRRYPSQESAAAPTLVMGPRVPAPSSPPPGGPSEQQPRRDLSALEGGWLLTTVLGAAASLHLAYALHAHISHCTCTRSLGDRACSFHDPALYTQI